MIDKDAVELADELLEDYFNGYGGTYNMSPHEAWNIIHNALKDQEDIINRLKSDVAELIEKLDRYDDIVLCKDCEYNNDYNACPMMTGMVEIPDDWYCAGGFRKSVIMDDLL